MFNSIISSYYAGFIPCAFSPSFLSYEVWWVAQHTLTTFLGCLTLYLVHCFPAGYNHLLHRTSLYLGQWHKMEGRISANFYNQWSAASLWPGAAIVRHGKDLYKAEGPVNAAEPGNSCHMRYYFLFGDPSLLVCALLMVQASLVTFQLLVIAKSQFWYHLMSQVSSPLLSQPRAAAPVTENNSYAFRAFWRSETSTRCSSSQGII